MTQCPNVATTWLAARRVWRTDRSLLRSLSQTRCSRAVVFLDDTRWYRTTADSFMAVTVTLTMAASEARRLSSKYRFNWPCCALALSRRCQPSTSLLLRTLQPNTDHVDGGHTVDSSHVARFSRLKESPLKLAAPCLLQHAIPGRVGGVVLVVEWADMKDVGCMPRMRKRCFCVILLSPSGSVVTIDHKI